MLAITSVFIAGERSASAQVISSVVAAKITDTSAVITWTTDTPASSLILYGETMDYGYTSGLRTALATTHSVTLDGLNANTLYNFNVVSSAPGAAATASHNLRFATLSTSPVISDVNVIHVTGSRGTVNWTTDLTSTGIVHYGTTPNYTSSTPTVSTPANAHSVTLSALEPNTTYHFSVASVDPAGVQSDSADQTFTTPPAGVAAPSLDSVTIWGVTPSSAMISWKTDMPGNAFVAYGTTPALGHFSAVDEAHSASHRVSLTGLRAGTTYYFSAISAGANRTRGYSRIGTFTTAGTYSSVPVISKIATSNPTETSTTITWTTDVPGTSLVNYGTTTSHGLSVLDSTMTRTHSMALTGLSPGAPYDYQIVSSNQAGSATASANLSATTIWAWGDSQTAGGNDGTGVNYPGTLAATLGIPVMNQGVGGNTSTQVAQRMLATPASFGPENCHVFWTGNTTPLLGSQTLADIASMVSALAAPKCYLVLSVINHADSPIGSYPYNSVISTDTSLAAQYGNNYLDIRKFLVQSYNPALPMDVADHGNDIIPASLRAVQRLGSITSGSLNSTSCAFSVSNGTLGPGTVVLIDFETILINSLDSSGNNITGCVRGYNTSAATNHAANSNYYKIDITHVGGSGLQLVAAQVAAWFRTLTPPSPAITAVTASNISSTTAVITWTTDQPATSRVNYGATTGYGSQSTPDGTLTTNHSVTLTGLAPNTAYNFDVVSVNSGGGSSTSANATFATSPMPALTISSIASGNLTPTSATISWTTSQPTTAQVNYGTTTAYGSTTTATTTLATNQVVSLTGLTPNTTYNFRVISVNSSNVSATSSNATFTTPSQATNAPSVGYVAFWGVNDTGVTISWSTDVNANTVVAYGSTPTLGQIYTNNSPGSASTTSHGAVLTSLIPGTKYYFVAQSTGSNGVTGFSSVYSFTTTGTAPILPSFTLSATSSVAGVGSTGTSTIAVTPANGFNSPVTLAASNWPAGITGTFGTNPAASSSAVAISVSAGVSPGPYSLTVNGTSGALIASTTIPLTVSPAVAPVITNVQFSNVTSTSATVTWQTDQPSSSLVSYGTTAAYGASTPQDATLVTSHQATIAGLTPSTLYHFSVKSANASGTPSTSTDAIFTTSATSTGPAPQVGYVAFWGINNSGVTISWSTDVLATTRVGYGTTTALGQLSPVQDQNPMVVGHGAVLTGLNPGTKYYFVCQSTGANGSTGYSTVFSFTTTGTPAVAPVISNITVTNITTASATINWTTDQAATSVVNYGTTPSYGLSATGAASTTSHSVTLTGLTPGTLYDFDVMSANAAGTTAISANGTLTTSAAVANPPLISGINTTNLTNTSVTVNWTTDQASTSVVNYGTTTGYGLSSSTPAASTTHSVTLTGLTPGTTYNFVVVSALSSGPSAISGNNVFTTPALSGNSPMLSYLAFYGVTASGVTISWSTNVPSTTVLVYGTTASFGQVTPVQTTLSTTHGVTLTGLLPGTAYYFQAQSADSSGNLGISTTYSFTTQGSLGQVITNVVATPGPGPTGTISFNTSVPAYSYVQYGTSAGSYGRYSNRTALTTSPVCTLPYVPSGPVHFQIVSQDVSGNTTTSPDMTFLQP